MDNLLYYKILIINTTLYQQINLILKKKILIKILVIHYFILNDRFLEGKTFPKIE